MGGHSVEGHKVDCITRRWPAGRPCSKRGGFCYMHARRLYICVLYMYIYIYKIIYVYVCGKAHYLM